MRSIAKSVLTIFPWKLSAAKARERAQLVVREAPGSVLHPRRKRARVARR
jgi:hypothetical protein